MMMQDPSTAAGQPDDDAHRVRSAFRLGWAITELAAAIGST